MAQRLHQPKLPEEIKFQRKSTAGMALSRSPKQLGRTVPSSHAGGNEHKSNGPMLPTCRQFQGNSPGPLGRNDWADPNFKSQNNNQSSTRPTVPNLLLIPEIMRAQRWFNSAVLLEKWFRNPANDKAEKGEPDTTTIKMDSWVLTFERAKKVFDEIVSQRVWWNSASQAQILPLLKQKKKLIPRPLNEPFQRIEFGDFSQPVPLIDREYINFRPVKSYWKSWTDNVVTNDLDDLYGALGEFVFRIAVKGAIYSEKNEKYTVYIEEVGIYVRDSFDFEGSQPLGFWNISSKYGGKNPLGGTYVSNDTFREWRRLHGRGGDFLVYSDLKRIKLNPPDIFVFQL